ncbi:NADH dehydrogenase subunit H [Isosphaera pallida ATCC 43644]|uniref:NADH-quinone oxidoreductase subunit H n=1 Tax=Isosphaera pallida (strain ATCC 43644 / DSM 9630 / IS1B) TaxID=575540 RepID=E8QZ73_ISOPI|nr:NADH-quinone oxidoreductase subunit NuoH [Isosphaera pallida]ADV64202.1 NADH dehydrogenase subunit H [Isosphaera pallida ATCC 43644]
MPQPLIDLLNILFGLGLIQMAVVIGTTMGVTAYLILLERKVAAFAQDRLGPNRAGPLGLIQAIADGLKLLVKEDFTPAYVNKPLFTLAPMIAMIGGLITYAVVPFGPVSADGLYIGPVGPIQFQIAPHVDIGILYMFAVSSLTVYGVVLAGYSSNNKYSFLGGLRSSAQIISYEVPLGLSIMGMVLLAGSLDLTRIIHWQDRNVWGIVAQPLGFFIFLVSAFAETNRLPFDLPESEQELVGGFHTEYSSMRWAMFFLGEYLHVIAVSLLVAILFLGGWDLPFPFHHVLDQDQTGWVPALLKTVVLCVKVGALIFFIMWVRWTLFRFRYDTLMNLAWKALIPLALLNLVVTATAVQFLRG